jgi:predicted Fe-Mo cluster-binding NifX family protein
MAERKKKDDTIILQKTPQTKFVAVAYGGDGEIPYFEQAEYYEFYTIVNGRKVRKNMLSLPDTNVRTAIRTLYDMKTDTVICRGFGPKALHELKKNGIQCCIFTGGPQAGLKAWLEGRAEEM